MFENFAEIKSAPLFDGIAETELPELLGALEARSRRYAGGEIILNEGERTDSLGLVLSGSVLIVQDDFWGNRNILARITRGGIFAESFACTGERLTVGAQAESDCEIMRLKVEYVLKSCPKSCSAHSALVGNLIHELGKSCSATFLLNSRRQAVGPSKSRLTASSSPTICALTAARCPLSSARSGTTECWNLKKITLFCCDNPVLRQHCTINYPLK